jgi:hypothetical protein
MSGKFEKLLLVEFNELCPPLLERWMKDGSLPNFSRLHAESSVFTTTVDVTDDKYLEPWIQWYSLHTGIPFSEHQVFHLTDGVRSEIPDIWRTLAAAGKKVGSFGSMNVRPFDTKDGFFIGDPWCEHEDAFPKELNRFNRFVSSMVREHTNPNSSGRLAMAYDFLTFMLANGLSLPTFASIAKQLVSEKLGSAQSYQRVSAMDQLQLDVFAKYYKKSAPDFATFFSNSTAHLQHAYWKYMEPEKFDGAAKPADVAKYRDAIKFGYKNMDSLLGRFFVLAEQNNARIVFATALSQQACPESVSNGDKPYFRLFNINEFLGNCGLAYKTADPTMTHQYLVTFDEPTQRAAFVEKLSKMKLANGDQLFGVNDWDKENVYMGCNVVDSTYAGTFSDPTGQSKSFGDFFYQIPTTKNGRHHPDGNLWIQNDSHSVSNSKVSILDVFPTVLRLLKVSPSGGAFKYRSPLEV